MRLLFVSGWFPYPPDNGARTRIYNLLRELSKTYSIHLLSFLEGTSTVTIDHLAALEDFCSSVETISRPAYPSNRLRIARSIINGKPPWIALRYNSEMTTLANEKVAMFGPDLIIVSQVQMLPLLEQTQFTSPVILEQFEVGTIWDRDDESRGIGSIKAVSTRNIWSRYLRPRLKNLSGATVPSKREGEILKSLLPIGSSLHSQIHLLPTGINPDYLKRPVIDTAGTVLIYQGSIQFRANFDSVSYFLSDILPSVKRQVPGVLLKVTGSSEGVDKSKIAGVGIEFTGYLDCIEDEVASADVCVIPLRVGSGIRFKALEAMALGTPVVSTSKGVQGIDVQHGVHVLIADDPETFAMGVIQLLSDKDLRAELVRNARRLIAEKYTWDIIGQKFSDYCRHIASGLTTH